MRPARSYGDVRLQLAQAWSQGPAPVRVAAERACVGIAVARYTASRMVDRGELVVLHGGKPAVLAPALAFAAASPASAVARATPTSAAAAMDLLRGAWWGPDMR